MALCIKVANALTIMVLACCPSSSLLGMASGMLAEAIEVDWLAGCLPRRLVGRRAGWPVGQRGYCPLLAQMEHHYGLGIDHPKVDILLASTMHYAYGILIQWVYG